MYFQPSSRPNGWTRNSTSHSLHAPLTATHQLHSIKISISASPPQRSTSPPSPSSPQPSLTPCAQFVHASSSLSRILFSPPTYNGPYIPRPSLRQHHHHHPSPSLNHPQRSSRLHHPTTTCRTRTRSHMLGPDVMRQPRGRAHRARLSPRGGGKGAGRGGLGSEPRD